MPRKNKRLPDEEQIVLRREDRSATAPLWAQVDGYAVRVVFGQKGYRCPGCDQTIRHGSQHLVVVPDEDADARRHWHTECWRRELRRLGLT